MLNALGPTAQMSGDEGVGGGRNPAIERVYANASRDKRIDVCCRHFILEAAGLRISAAVCSAARVTVWRRLGPLRAPFGRSGPTPGAARTASQAPEAVGR